MSAPAARSLRADTASADAPRFALRFEDGRGMLALARPLRFAFGAVESLELSLGALRFPLDLSAGAARFRTRRTRVRAAHVRIDLPALLAHLVEEPYRVAPLAQRGEGASLALTDPFGTVAFDVHAAAEGPDLWLAIASARSAIEGPAPPAIRVLAAARALGLELDEARGAIALRGALSSTLLEALVPRGWRVPDDRGVRLAVEVLGPHRIALRTLDDGEPEPPIDADAFERARRLAPSTSALARGDRDEARRLFEVARERVGDLPPALAREAEALGLLASIGSHASDPLALTLALRRSVREGRAGDAIEHARALSAIEPSDAIAIEALCTAAELALARTPSVAAELLERAAARRARDPRIALRLVEALTRVPGDERLRAAIDAALAAREPGPERAELAREAAAICELADRHDEAARLYRAAADGLPHDARVLDGIASVEARAGQHAEALRLFDRAAEAFLAEGDPDDGRRALQRAAKSAEQLGRPAIAEERLARAAELAPHDAEVWARLARVRRECGALPAAVRAEDRLLESLEGVAPGRASDAIAGALVAAERAATDRGESERARTFSSALARVTTAHPAHEDPPHAPESDAGFRTTAPDERRDAAPIEADSPLAEGPLARAELAARSRDSAGLRAALNAAERAGDLESARRIVDLALSIVGEGPARRALEATRERLRAR